MRQSSMGLKSPLMVAQKMLCLVNNIVQECIIPMGEAWVYYERLDPDGNSYDSQLIRAGIWRTEDCGLLKAKIKEDEVLLAKANPDECIDVGHGWITDKNELVLLLSEGDSDG